MTTRDTTVDIVRGLAIFTMIGANMAPVLAEPHPFWFRLYGSFAAPLFILISGMMVAYTAQTRNHGFRYFLVRGMLVMAVGAFIDAFIWRYYPFLNIDVLYLIGISMPLAYLFLRLKLLPRWLIVIFIFSITPLLQGVLGYTDYPTEISILAEETAVVKNQTGIFNHWVIDGWFPIFPWLGFSLLGAIIATIRLKAEAIFKGNLAPLIGMGLLVFGGIIWYFYPGSLLTRKGYSELFYPPTAGYILTAIATITLLFSIVERNPSPLIYQPLCMLGQSALFVYIVHLFFIENVISSMWSEETVPTFLLIYGGLLVVLGSLAYGSTVVKARWRDRPFIVRFLLGS